MDSKKKILIVDDEEDYLDTTASFLANAGYEVVKTSSGKDATRLAKKEKPDLILLDIKMPGVDGSLTTDLLKNDLSTRDIPIIYLSSLVDETEVEEDGHIMGSRIGDLHFISKSQSSDKLFETVRKNIG